MNVDIERARREELRWIILRALDAARPIGTSESVIRSAIEPVVPDVTLVELRREMSYLEDRNLVSISGKNTPMWFAKLSRDGIDVVEYTIECHPGIARPKNW